MKNKKKAVSQANPRPELELLPLKPGVRATGPTRMPMLLRVKIPPVQAEVQVLSGRSSGEPGLPGRLPHAPRP